MVERRRLDRHHGPAVAGRRGLGVLAQLETGEGVAGVLARGRHCEHAVDPNVSAHGGSAGGVRRRELARPTYPIGVPKGAGCAILVAGSDHLNFPQPVRTGVNLTSYAELAVRLVNTAFRANSVPDPLGTTDDFRMLVSDHPHLSGPVTPFDLDALNVLRTELSVIFTAAATGRDREAVDRLNTLMIRSPIQPELVSHDDQRWHVHLAQSGSVADRYAAGAVIGLALAVSQFGLSRLGTCSIAACQQV